MGIGGISIWQLLIILAIIVLLFGTKRLRNIGSDLGSAIKGFRNSIKEPEQENQDAAFPAPQQPAVTAQPVQPTPTGTPAASAAPSQNNQAAAQAQDKQG